MILIIGGAYQGKLDFAKDTFGITDEDVFTCSNGEIDFSKRCIYKIEEFTYLGEHFTILFQQKVPQV